MNSILKFLFFISFVLMTSQCEAMMKKSNSTPEQIFSGSTIKKDCSPKRSNDCTIRDALVLQEPELKLDWENLTFRATQLPSNSWYKIEKSDSSDFEMTLYPNVGPHYILGQHDFTFVISIHKSERVNQAESQITKIENVSDDMSDLKLQNGIYDIEIKQRLNYYYDGGPGSNPNPFTSEVVNILKSVLKNIVIQPKSTH